MGNGEVDRHRLRRQIANRDEKSEKVQATNDVINNPAQHYFPSTTASFQKFVFILVPSMSSANPILKQDG